MAFSKGGLQKDEQKHLVNSLWAWNTNTLRKHLWFVHPSVNLTFSVIFIFPFPGQAQREQILHVQKICHHIPLLNNTCFRKLLILAFIHMAAFCGGGGGPGAINSLFLTQWQLLLWRIDVRNSNWRYESSSGQFSPGCDENSAGSERQVKYILWMHFEVRDHTKYAGQRPLILSLKSSCDFRHGWCKIKQNKDKNKISCGFGCHFVNILLCWMLNSHFKTSGFPHLFARRVPPLTFSHKNTQLKLNSTSFLCYKPICTFGVSEVQIGVSLQRL